METRLQELIRYKTNGKQTEFASMIGWSPQYLAKLLKGVNFGLNPVMTILEKFPEVNARWFLFGQGSMLETEKIVDLQRQTIANVYYVLEMEKFIPFMTSEELYEYEQAVITGRKPIFSQDKISSWQHSLNEQEKELTQKFNNAKSKSNKTQCKPKTAKK